MTKRPTVRVLLSTYNGERYIREQLDSLLAQIGVTVEVSVRDDGSTDLTPEILAEYAARHACLSVTRGPNIGVVQSFFALLREAPANEEYVAFADQDDVWDAGKLVRAAERLRGVTGPAMYCSRVRIVDEALRPISLSHRSPCRPEFRNALVENIATGCTIVLNTAARATVVESLPAMNANMHDWWIYQVISGTGVVVFDPEPHMWYRQHSANAVGVSSGLRQWYTRWRLFVDGGNRLKITRQAQELAERYLVALPSAHRVTLERFLERRGSVFARLRYAITCNVRRHRLADNLILRLLIILGRV